MPDTRPRALIHLLIHSLIHSSIDTCVHLPFLWKHSSIPQICLTCQLCAGDTEVKRKGTASLPRNSLSQERSEKRVTSAGPAKGAAEAWERLSTGSDAEHKFLQAKGRQSSFHHNYQLPLRSSYWGLPLIGCII